VDGGNVFSGGSGEWGAGKTGELPHLLDTIGVSYVKACYREFPNKVSLSSAPPTAVKGKSRNKALAVRRRAGQHASQ
jgi:hypothetical protein